ncbi:histidine kinase [Mesorhizobium loti NZP2037]|nr:histidine kinase [Mesorhizobium loti NZP2037]
MQHQAGANETILIVEDEPVIRLNIADYLRVQGFRVVEATSAVEAIAIMQSDVVKVDLVFSDVQTPGDMDGFGLSHWLRVNRPDVPLILTSAYAMAFETEAIVDQRRPFVAKPYDEQHVVCRIRSLLTNH